MVIIRTYIKVVNFPQKIIFSLQKERKKMYMESGIQPKINYFYFYLSYLAQTNLNMILLRKTFKLFILYYKVNAEMLSGIFNIYFIFEWHTHKNIISMLLLFFFTN